MAATLVTATDEILVLFEAIWAKAHEAAGLPGPFKYVNNLIDPDGVPNDAQKRPWARIKIVHATGQSTSVSSRRYQNGGTVFIQIFVPKNTTDAGSKAQYIAQFVARALQMHRGNVTITSVRHNDVPADGPYFRQEVLYQFSWIEVRRSRYGSQDDDVLAEEQGIPLVSDTQLPLWLNETAPNPIKFSDLPTVEIEDPSGKYIFVYDPTVEDPAQRVFRVDLSTVAGSGEGGGTVNPAPKRYPINGVASLNAAHGLSYFPDTWIVDVAGNEVEADVTHSPGAVNVVFSQPFTGSLYVR